MRGAADDWRDCPRPDTRLPRPPRLAADGGSERGTMTDHTPGAPPVIVLVRPQLGENIGKAARAMLNFRSEEHTSELQSLMRISYAVFCLTKKKNRITTKNDLYTTHSYTPTHNTQQHS